MKGQQHKNHIVKSVENAESLLYQKLSEISNEYKDKCEIIALIEKKV